MPNLECRQGSPGYAPSPVALTYEDFSAEFPSLLESLTIDLNDGRIVSRSYRTRANPPVLHRKELLLGPDDPAVEAFGLSTDAS